MAGHDRAPRFSARLTRDKRFDQYEQLGMNAVHSRRSADAAECLGTDSRRRPKRLFGTTRRAHA